jgi:hypothetical protein
VLIGELVALSSKAADARKVGGRCRRIDGVRAEPEAGRCRHGAVTASVAASAEVVRMEPAKELLVGGRLA